MHFRGSDGLEWEGKPKMDQYRSPWTTARKEDLNWFKSLATPLRFQKVRTVAAAVKNLKCLVDGNCTFETLRREENSIRSSSVCATSILISSIERRDHWAPPPNSTSKQLAREGAGKASHWNVDSKRVGERRHDFKRISSGAASSKHRQRFAYRKEMQYLAKTN